MANHKIRRKRETQTCYVCDAKFDKDKGQCPECGNWNVDRPFDTSKDQTLTLDEVEDDVNEQRICTGPWDIVFCKDEPGIVTTSVTLLGGKPGAGKSTMSIQLCDSIAEATQREVFYVGAEEAPKEYKARAKRLGLKNISRIRLYPMHASADMGAILLSRRPCAIVIDSLQGLTDDIDAQAQICKTFKQYAVELNAPVIVISHVTKDGDFAGLMALQHHVDTVLLMSPIADSEVRYLEGKKNRYGPANFGIYLEMTGQGLREYVEEAEETG